MANWNFYVRPSTDEENDYEVEIPRFRLMQSMSMEVVDDIAEPGEFVIDGREKHETDLVIIPTQHWRRREYRLPKELDEWRTLVCRSADNITGYGLPGGECGKCPMIRWCTLIDDYIIWIPKLRTYAKWSIQSKTQRRTSQRMNRYFSTHGAGNFAMHVMSEEGGKEGREYWVPVIRELSRAGYEVPVRGNQLYV